MIYIIKIAICEDEYIFITLLISIIERNLKSLNLEYYIDCYTSGEELLNETMNFNEIYDIIFFDIQLPGIDGIKTAEIIRCIDDTSIFIFITSMDEKVYEIFELNPFDFIRKSHFEIEIDSVLHRLFNNFDSLFKKYHFNTICEEKVYLKLNEIMYFDIEDRHVIIHTRFKNYTTTHRTLKSIPINFEKKYFYEIYHGIFVNLNYIKRVENNIALLKNNEKLPISRRNSSKFKNVFFDFLKTRKE